MFIGYTMYYVKRCDNPVHFTYFYCAALLVRSYFLPSIESALLVQPLFYNRTLFYVLAETEGGDRVMSRRVHIHPLQEYDVYSTSVHVVLCDPCARRVVWTEIPLCVVLPSLLSLMLHAVHRASDIRSIQGKVQGSSSVLLLQKTSQPWIGSL